MLCTTICSLPYCTDNRNYNPPPLQLHDSFLSTSVVAAFLCYDHKETSGTQYDMCYCVKLMRMFIVMWHWIFQYNPFNRPIYIATIVLWLNLVCKTGNYTFFIISTEQDILVCCMMLKYLSTCVAAVTRSNNLYW